MTIALCIRGTEARIPTAHTGGRLREDYILWMVTDNDICLRTIEWRKMHTVVIKHMCLVPYCKPSRLAPGSVFEDTAHEQRKSGSPAKGGSPSSVVEWEALL